MVNEHIYILDVHAKNNHSRILQLCTFEERYPEFPATVLHFFDIADLEQTDIFGRSFPVLFPFL